MKNTRKNPLVRDFVTQEITILHPNALDIDDKIHSLIYAKEKLLSQEKQRVSLLSIPEVLYIITSPGLVDVCYRILG